MSFSDLEKEYPDVCISHRNEPVIQLYSETGWFNIVKTILAEARNYNVKISLIKEKWGGLRVYNDGRNAVFDKICSCGKNLASKTCEQCGKYGQLRESGGWYVTGCVSCYPGFKIHKPN